MWKMIIIFTIVSIMLCCLFRASHAEENNSGWYPFVLAEKLDPDSPANIGKLVLDSPAGKHGFLKVKDGHFYFEDGKRVKFWGTNLCFHACFPTKTQAELIADRIAFFGFNAVRLHHMDNGPEPRGIFEKTGKISAHQIDKLDYLIYLLKQRGIYVDMNLLVSRRFKERDGVADADMLEMAAKPVSMFDRKLIELQKQYAKDLLTHYNPYTNLRYCDDPVIALVEIINESSIMAYWKQERLNAWSPYSFTDPIPEYYRKELDALWGKNSPRPLYKALNLYSKDTQDEIKEFYIGLEKKYCNEMIGFLKNECGMKCPITGIGGYRTAEDVEAQLSCNFIDKHAYWDHPRFPRKDWDKNDFIIHDRSMLLDKRLGIIDTIKGGRLEKNKPYTITEWNHCYPNQYAYETPVLIACEAAKNGWDALFQFAFSHGWDAEPYFYNINSYFDIIANFQKLTLCSLGSVILQKMDHMEAHVANGIFKLNSSRINGVVGFIKNKAVCNSPLAIRSKQNGAVFICSVDDRSIQNSDKLVLIAVSEIRNKGDKWQMQKFIWGTSPVFLKKMDVVVELALNKKFRVYELDERGMRGKKIEAAFKNNAVIFSIDKSNTPWFEMDAE